MDHGWSLKHLHRLIVTSATYRQSSQVTPELLASDPYNRLLARGAAVPRRRRDRPRHRAGGQRPAEPEGRRPERLCRRRRTFLFQPPASYGAVPVERGDRPRPLPPRALHLPPPLDAVPVLQTFDAPERRRRLRPPGALEHAAAGADDAERDRSSSRPRGPWRCGSSPKAARRDAERARPTPSAAALSRPPTDDEQRDPARAAGASRRRAFADGWVNALGARDRRRTELPDDLPEGATPAQLGRLHRRRARAAEPRRDDHEGMTRGPRR